ncbi:MAG: hypothetical protein ACKOPQ_11545 [Novosphingobium sp.]
MDLSGKPLSVPQYWTEWDERGERLVMPIRRSWKVIGSALFFFALGSVQHARLVGEGANFFEYIFLAIIVAGALHFVLRTLTSLVAREVLRIEAGTLIHGWEIFGIKREKRYPLRDIYGLSADRDLSLPEAKQLFSPIKDFGKIGAVNFDYKGDTIALGAAIDDAHAQGLVDWIARRSPRSVFDLTSPVVPSAT